MTQALQFTVDQVAKQLGLSESVVNRLSQYFQVPRSYFRSAPGQPRILLYASHEMELLREIQQRLVAGESLSDLKEQMMARVTAMPVAPAAPVISASPVEAFDAFEEGKDPWEDESDLVEYEHSEQMKEQLAQVTYKQYRHDNAPQKAPFEALAQTFQQEREARTPEAAVPPRKTRATRPAPPITGEPISQILRKQASGEPGQPFSGTVPGRVWMTEDLMDRVLELQHQLLSGTR